MRVLLLGATGQVGRELLLSLRCFAVVLAPDRSTLDLTHSAELVSVIERFKPDVIVNAAAYTNVDLAEEYPAAAWALNAHLVGVLGEEAKARKIGLVHYSTDFVFDGAQDEGYRYREGDATNPLNVYGKSKLAGEEYLRGAPAIVLRTAWVWSLRPGARNFVNAIMRAARTQDELRVVGDQVGSPTSARDLAQATACLLHGMYPAAFERIRDVRGVYHVAGGGYCSRFQFAVEILSLDPRSQEHVFTSMESTESLSVGVARPKQVRLDCDRFARLFDLRLPAWEHSLALEVA